LHSHRQIKRFRLRLRKGLQLYVIAATPCFLHQNAQSQVSREAPEEPTFMATDDRLGNYERSFLNVAHCYVMTQRVLLST